MSQADFTGIGPISVPDAPRAATEHIVLQNALQRVLSFLGRSIDDVVNDPIARAEVIGFYKLHKWILRECEISDLERQWNAIAV
jgi:hypothetical protein